MSALGGKADIARVAVNAFGLAQSRRRLDQRVEHGPQIEGRAANDFEHFGRCGLLLQRLFQLATEPRDFRFLAGSGRTATEHGFRSIETL